MKTLLLCGGRGTRAHPYTLDVPKPLLEVAGRAVVEHVMEIFAAQGHEEFVLAGGYKLELLQDFADRLDRPWSVTVVDTGVDADKGERMWRCRDLLGSRFFCTYADGLGDVDLGRLLATHEAHGCLATVTTVPLPSPYGTIDISEAGLVREFREKPHLAEHPINAGFFVFEHAVFDDWPGGDLESSVLPALSRRGQLHAYRHDGFWRSMDTHKDSVELTELCGEGPPPWAPRHRR